MRIVSWAMSYDLIKDRLRPLIDTALVNGVTVEWMGSDQEFTFLRQKLEVLRNYLDGMDDKELVVCLDGFDVLIARSLDSLAEDFYSFNTKVLMSAEKIFTYQYGHYQDKFDALKSDYRYVNSGTFMGECKHLKEMLDELMFYETSDGTKIDQGLVGIYVYNWMDDSSIIQLDTGAKIFWVTSKDWDVLRDVANDGILPIRNPFTQTAPYFIHNLCNLTPPGDAAHAAAYKAITKHEI